MLDNPNGVMLDKTKGVMLDNSNGVILDIPNEANSAKLIEYPSKSRFICDNFLHILCIKIHKDYKYIVEPPI